VPIVRRVPSSGSGAVSGVGCRPAGDAAPIAVTKAAGVRSSGRSIAKVAIWVAASVSKRRWIDALTSRGSEARASISHVRSAAGRSSVDPASSDRLNTKS